MTAWHVAGADLDSQNYDQRTALHIAVAENNEDIVRFLISQVRFFFLRNWYGNVAFKGCDPEHKDRFGRSPIDEINEDNTTLKELLDWGLSLKTGSIENLNDESSWILEAWNKCKTAWYLALKMNSSKEEKIVFWRFSKKYFHLLSIIEIGNLNVS